MYTSQPRNPLKLLRKPVIHRLTEFVHRRAIACHSSKVSDNCFETLSVLESLLVIHFVENCSIASQLAKKNLPKHFPQALEFSTFVDEDAWGEVVSQ